MLGSPNAELEFLSPVALVAVGVVELAESVSNDPDDCLVWCVRAPVDFRHFGDPFVRSGRTIYPFGFSPENFFWWAQPRDSGKAPHRDGAGPSDHFVVAGALRVRRALVVGAAFGASTGAASISLRRAAIAPGSSAGTVSRFSRSVSAPLRSDATVRPR